MIIIAKLSFWVKKPLVESAMDALGQFKMQNYVEKLKTHITYASTPLDHDGLVKFLYDQIIHI